MKPIELTNKSSKYMGQIRGYMYDEELMNELQNPVSQQP